MGADMPLWIGILLAVVLGMLAIIGFAGWWHNADKDHTAYWNMEKENRQLREDLEGTRATIKARDIEIAGLYGEKTALRLENERYAETVVELNEEVRRLHKSADHATIPLQEVAPEPAKRPIRGKKAGAQ